MPKLTFYIPAKLQLDVPNIKDRAKVKEAVKAKVKGYQHPIRFEKTIMSAFDKKRFTVEEK